MTSCFAKCIYTYSFYKKLQICTCTCSFGLPGFSLNLQYCHRKSNQINFRPRIVCEKSKSRKHHIEIHFGFCIANSELRFKKRLPFLITMHFCLFRTMYVSKSKKNFKQFDVFFILINKTSPFC